MSENVPPSTAPSGTDVPGQPFYDKTRAHLKDLLHRRRVLERSLAAQEDAIYKKETDYLEDTPSGNIITGFEAYTKGSSTVPGQRRRVLVQEGNRVFSRSSVSYTLNAVSEGWFLGCLGSYCGLGTRGTGGLWWREWGLSFGGMGLRERRGEKEGL